MSLFRLLENVPDVYSNESRDFQLLCNAFDVIQNSIKNEADSMCLVSDTSSCPDTLLPYLQTKLGFFTKQKIDSDKLRIILQAFPHIVKSKGSRNGIILAIRAFLKCIHKAEIVQLDILNNELSSIGGIERDYVVTIGMNGEITDISLLEELLKYVIPAGYDVKYYFFKDTQALTSVRPSNTIRIFFLKKGDSPVDINSSVAPSNTTEGHYTDSTMYVIDDKGEHGSVDISTDYVKHFNSIGTVRVVEEEGSTGE